MIDVSGAIPMPDDVIGKKRRMKLIKRAVKPIHTFPKKRKKRRKK